MARLKDQFARNSAVPSINQKKTDDLGSSLPNSRNAYPIHPKVPSLGAPLASIHHDTQASVHSTPQLLDTQDHMSPMSFEPPTSPSREGEISRYCNVATTNRLLYGQPQPTSRQSMGIPALTESAEKSDRSSSKSRRTSTSNMPKMSLPGMISQEDPSSTSIDLSRSFFEQDGLGIFTTHEKERRQTELVANHAARKNFPPGHHRSTSGTSQFSAESSSSVSRPVPQYVHPMRQAPRGYTPPLGQSYQASIFESDDSGKPEAEGEFLAQSGSDVFYPSLRASPGQTARLSLQIQDNSFTRLPGTSQTNITGRSSFGYSRDNGSTLDTASPISRPSLDFVFRSKTRTSMDPVSRAATVQAARQAFEEKEAAKTKKFEEQQMKAEQRQMKRKEKPNWRTSLRGDEPHQAVWEETTLEKPRNASTQPQPESDPKSVPWRSQPKNTWMHFLTWLRTRIFKLRRKVKNIG